MDAHSVLERESFQMQGNCREDTIYGPMTIYYFNDIFVCSKDLYLINST